MQEKHSGLYTEVLGSALAPKKIAVYGIANYDDIFSISKKDLKALKINPVFDDIASRVLRHKTYREYNRDIADINGAISKLKSRTEEKVILGGNATNISLGLARLKNSVILNVKRAEKGMIDALGKEGVSTNASSSEAAHHLIVQVKEDRDRFIISPDYGLKEPELVEPAGTKCDMAVYSGAHLDAKNESVQEELVRRVKSISRSSGLYIELGTGSRLAEDNCIKVSGHADIVGMNEVELNILTGTQDLVKGGENYLLNHMKKNSLLIIHTLWGSLAISEKPVEGIEKAQALGHLQGSSRYIFGEYLSLVDMKKRFKKITLHKKEYNEKTGCSVSWVAGIKYPGHGMAVGSGDGYVAGFVTGILNFTRFR